VAAGMPLRRKKKSPDQPSRDLKFATPNMEKSAAYRPRTLTLVYLTTCAEFAGRYCIKVTPAISNNMANRPPSRHTLALPSLVSLLLVT
jgi:hypothetical protein